MFYKLLLTSSLMLCALHGSSAITINTARADYTPPPKLIRKSYITLTAKERLDHLNSVISFIKKDGDYYKSLASGFSNNFEKIVPDLMLPWNRYLLDKFENRLQRHGSEGKGIPYLEPYSLDLASSPVFHDFGCPNSNNGCVKDGLFATVQIPGKSCIVRGYAKGSSPTIPSAIILNRAVADSKDSQEISDRLQSGYLGIVHVVFGGTYATKDAAFDPLYYLLEASVDRLWYHWQQRHPNSCKVYKVGKADAECALPGFGARKVKDVLDINSLYYRYDN